MTDERPLLILVDGHAVAYRAFFSVSVDNFSTSDGLPTNAIWMFARKLLDILKEQPDYLAVSFDREGMSGRDALYEGYKSTREKMPDELFRQMEYIERMVEAFNIPVLSMNEYEADDVIGTVSKQAEEAGCRVRVISGDHDLLQLLSENVQIQLPIRKPGNTSDEIWDLAKYQERYTGLTPQQLIDYKGLKGDTSDNIPGVAGIGEKTALGLLNRYKGIEDIYEHLDEIEPRWRMKLEQGRESAFLSKQLATIHRDLPINIDLEKCVAHDFDGNVVRDLFHRLEFRSLGDELEKFLTKRGEQAGAVAFAAQEVFIPPHTIVTQQEQLQALVDELNNAKVISFDTETTSTDETNAELVGISLSTDGEHGYYIPLGHVNPNVQPSLFGDAEGTPEQLPMDTVLDALRPAMENPDIPKIAHNALYDLVVLRRYGVDVTPIVEDTMLAEFVHNPDSKFKGLKDLSYHRLKLKMKEIHELIGSGKNQITMDRVRVDDVAGYAAADAVIPVRLMPLMTNSLNHPSNPDALKVYKEIEVPLIPVLADMEIEGVLVNCDYLKELSVEMTERQKDIEREIWELCGEQFNVSSLKQLNHILFEVLRLPTEGLSKTKTGGFSLTADVLEEMAERIDHPVLRRIMDYRSLAKLLGTYIDALPKLVNPKTGRVHTCYNSTGAVTGRLASNNPNLQNIPIRTEDGQRIRKAFIAKPGHVLLSVDYSQIELRILAHYSDDETLRRAFENEEDIHRTTAAKVYGIEPEKVTSSQRSFAKRVNFGLMYGMGAFRLARESDLTLAEADAFIRAYFENFPGVRDYLENTKMQVAQDGYVRTLYGRRRYFPELTQDGNRQLKARAEREAINMPIQGTQADIIKKAMIELSQRLKAMGSNAKLLLQVHDELILEVPEAEVETIRPLVREVMVEAAREKITKVPIVADARVGLNWLDME